MSSSNSDSVLPQFSKQNLIQLWDERHRRIGVLMILLFYSFFPGDLGEVTRTSLFDAYIQVTVFVAATLLVFFSLEHFYKIDIGILMRKGDIWQVPMASLLGALPGCGGAVVVITAFARGNIRLGAMVAALIATMGDAAFLLLAKEPTTYLKLMSISIFAAVISGWTVDKFHRGELYSSEIKNFEKIGIGKLRVRDKLFMFFAAPGLFLGILQLAQIDVNNFGILVTVLGLTGWIHSRLWTSSFSYYTIFKRYYSICCINRQRNFKRWRCTISCNSLDPKNGSYCNTLQCHTSIDYFVFFLVCRLILLN